MQPPSKPAEQNDLQTENALLQADLFWCLGKLRGLGYPALQLEEKYKVDSPR
jgi:hypothetical protein